MIVTVIVILVIIAVAAIAFKSYKKTLEHGCCGAGGGSVETTAEEKKLDGPVIATRVVKIEGMTCINCQNRIQKRLNKIEGLSAQVDYKKKTAIVSMDREISDNAIRTAIVQLDYKVVSIT